MEEKLSKKLVLIVIRKYKAKYMYNNFIYNALVEVEQEIENLKEGE